MKNLAVEKKKYYVRFPILLAMRYSPAQHFLIFNLTVHRISKIPQFYGKSRSIKHRES